MSRYANTVADAPEGVAERAITHFGREGLGPEQPDTGPGCDTFAGGGGQVAFAGTEVELETRQWDFHVHDFPAQLWRRCMGPRRRWSEHGHAFHSGTIQALSGRQALR